MAVKTPLLSKKNIQPNLITHLESRLFKNILGRLSILDHQLNIIRKLEVPYQVILPKHRLDVCRDREAFYSEIKREFPQDCEMLEKFYENMDEFDTTLDNDKLQELILPKNLIEKWRFYQFIKKNELNRRISEYTENLGSDEMIQTFLESQVRFLSQTDSENPFTYQTTKVLSNDNCLLFEVKGGLGHLKKVFLEKIEQYNGRVKNEVQLEAIDYERKLLFPKVKSLRLGGFEGTIGCRYLIWNEKIQRLKEFIPETIRTRFLVQRIEKIHPKFYHFSIQFHIHPGFIPVGMKENALLINEPKSELTGSNYLHLNLFHPGPDYPDTPVAITVSYLLEAEKIDNPMEDFEELHEEIKQRLHQLMPFSEGQLKLSFPKTHENRSEEGMLFSLEKQDFEIFLENARNNPVYGVEAEKFSDLFPISNRTPYRNFFLSSPEILPTLGFEGKFLLGLKTIELIWQENEKAKRKKALKTNKIVRNKV